ncbi:MAG: cytochrome P450, partial [Chloroflexota bacterium]
MNGWTRAALVGAAVGAGVLGYTAARRLRSASEHRPPGSQGLPFIGETLSYSSNPHRFIEERHRKHGDVFKTRILGDDVVCFVGPEAFTFFTESPYFDRQGGSPKNVRELLAHESLPLLGGEQHREARAKVQQAFTQEAVSGLLGGIQEVLESYAERWAHKGTFRWVDEFKSLSATLCADMLLGQGGPERHRDDLVPVLDEFLAGLNSVPLNLPFTTYGRAIRRRDELLGMIDRARRNKVGYSHYDILSLLITARDENGGRLPEAQLRAHILH